MIAQAQVLERKDIRKSSNATPKARTSSTPPSVDEMALLDSGIVQVEEMKTLTKSALSALSLTWEEDVEDVYQNIDFVRNIFSKKQRLTSFNIRWAVHAKSRNLNDVRVAFEKTLEIHSTFRSVVAHMDDDEPVQVRIGPSKHWYDQCIRIGNPVKSAQDLVKLIPSQDLDFAGPPLPLLQAHIFQIEDADEVGLIISLHHSIHDAFSLKMFAEDFESLLDGRTPERVPSNFLQILIIFIRAVPPRRRAFAFRSTD